MPEHDIERVIETTVHTTLTKVGFDLSDPISIQADMHFLRSLRSLASKAGTKVVMVLIGVAATGVAGGTLIAIGKAIKEVVS